MPFPIDPNHFLIKITPVNPTYQARINSLESYIDPYEPDVEYSIVSLLKKAPDTYRIFILGDSTSFGWGVNQDERFSELLEKRLNTIPSQYRYEIYNFGIPGYSSYHGRQLFDHYVLKYEPDMVILSFGANDSRKVSKDIKAVLRQSPAIPIGWDIKFWPTPFMKGSSRQESNPVPDFTAIIPQSNYLISHSDHRPV